MNALQEVIHSARELVNEHRHAYPPVWAKDANEIIDAAAAELAALRARVGELEQERDRMKNKLIMVSKWFERQADMFEKQAKNSRFETITKAAEFDAKNYKIMADDILAAALAKGAK